MAKKLYEVTLVAYIDPERIDEISDALHNLVCDVPLDDPNRADEECSALVASFIPQEDL